MTWGWGWGGRKEVAGKNVEEGPKGPGVPWKCKGSEAGKSLVSLEKLIGGGSLRTEAGDVGGGG